MEVSRRLGNGTGGQGECSDVLYEYRADTVLLAENCATLEQIAKEVEHRNQQVQPSGLLGGPLAFVERTM